MASNYFMFRFNPLKELSLKALLYDVPRLSGMPSDELVPVWRCRAFSRLFRQLCADRRGENAAAIWHEYDSDVAMPITCAEDWLGEIDPNAWKLKTVASSGAYDDASDIQRKIDPWPSRGPDALARYEMETGGLRRQTSHLIVVASLLDKANNLGGLCRTCEVFGAREMVVANLAVVDDKAFESLAVSAQNWLTMTEVRPHDIAAYLAARRADGYALIGAEQTERSAELGSHAFAPKTLLLLGNEKEGIPPHLLHLLDACVEIPQRGVIRSLNVHVSGALLIWEYAKQHGLTNGEVSDDLA